MPRSLFSSGPRWLRSPGRRSSRATWVNGSSGSASPKRTTCSPKHARESVSSGSDRRRFEVPASLDGRPLDRALRTLAEVTWGDARTLVSRGKVKVGGVVVTEAERRVSGGDAIEIDPHAAAPKKKAPL